MRYFAVKTSDPEFFSAYSCGEDHLILDGINSYDDIIKPGIVLFVILGGDRVEWNKGLAAVALTESGPVDKGYDEDKPKNYKLKFRIVSRMKEVLGKDKFVPYKGTYNSYVGPSTKGERNQALTEINRKQATAVLHAVLDYYPDEEDNISSIIPADDMSEIKMDTEVLVPKILKYGQRPEREPEIEPKGNDSEDSTLHNDDAGKNILLYGVPGSGKSFTVTSEYCSDDNLCERVVFHPDYSYSDFVGQIMPKVRDKMIEYEFVPGPFTSIVNKAVHDENNMYYLIIELNRGNAPAIFGDVFQLLDREKDGTSRYGVTNAEAAKIIYDGDTSRKVKIPRNLTIIATMNTSDQNVFTLDTAFKRRWKPRLIPNEIEKAEFAGNSILGTAVTWLRFTEVINSFISEESSGMTAGEDKRLGAFFIDSEDIEFLTDKDGQQKYNPAFAEKVLMYLWDDVFKYNRDDVFKDEYHTLEDLIQGFENAKFDVFKLDFSDSEEAHE